MKRGTIIIISSLLIIVGVLYYIIKYTQIFSNQTIYYGYFDKVSGLQSGSPILLHGVRVGRVKDVALNAQKIKVTLSINEEMKIPEGSMATIVTGDISGAKAIKLILGKSDRSIPAEGFIATASDTTMIEMFNSKITPILSSSKFLLKSADTALVDFNYLLLYGGLGKKAQNEIRFFDKDLQGFANTGNELKKQADEFGRIVDQADKIFANPAQKNTDINNKINSGLKTTERLSKTPFSSNMQELIIAANKLGKTINKIGKENKILNDKSSYINTTNSIDTLNKSLKETMENPSGIQLIGGGKKK